MILAGRLLKVAMLSSFANRGHQNFYTSKIDIIRRVHMQNPQNANRKKHSKDRPTPCNFFQRASCSHKTGHKTKCTCMCVLFVFPG